jgi:hypothetical protein
MYKFFRGTTLKEAKALEEGYQQSDLTFWTDSLEKAKMYSKGAVLEVVLDELPPHFNLRKAIAKGNEVHGNIHEWRISRHYFIQDGGFFNYIEETKIHEEGAYY